MGSGKMILITDEDEMGEYQKGVIEYFEKGVCDILKAFVISSYEKTNILK